MAEDIKQGALTSQIKFVQHFDVEWKKLWLRIECLVLFFMVPMALYWFRHLLAFKLMPVLLVASLGCLIYLFSDKKFDRSVLMILGYRYLKTKSILITSIEHSFLGIFLYMIGLGWFFYSGSIQ